jgi:hypothetical protein
MFFRTAWRHIPEIELFKTFFSQNILSVTPESQYRTLDLLAAWKVGERKQNAAPLVSCILQARQFMCFFTMNYCTYEKLRSWKTEAIPCNATNKCRNSVSAGEWMNPMLTEELSICSSVRLPLSWYLPKPLISRLFSISGRMLNEYGAVSRITIDKVRRVIHIFRDWCCHLVII